MKLKRGQNLDAEQLAIARMIDLRLKAHQTDLEIDALLSHPDADSMTSFVEGRLEPDDSRALVSHLVKCSSCRQMTAQLARMDDEVGDTVVPEKQSPFMDGLLERLRSGFAATEDAVFAYQETDQLTSEDAKPEDCDGNEDERTTR
jgi:anti-sigma factor RsiW